MTSSNFRLPCLENATGEEEKGSKAGNNEGLRVGDAESKSESMIVIVLYVNSQTSSRI